MFHTPLCLYRREIFMDFFIQQLINGINLGSIFALIAIGYTMVYGIIKLINFAHGDIMMLGAYMSYIFLVSFPLDLPVVVIIGIVMLLGAIFGILIEFLAYRKLRKAPRISALITAIGVSLFLENLAQKIFGATPKVQVQFISVEPVNVLGFNISRLTIYTIVISIVMMVLLTLFVHKTKPGKAMRAVSQDQDAARLMGINVNRVISLTFALGSALGALAGVFYSVAYTRVSAYMGLMPGLKAFVAAVLGGIGNIGGAVLGGYIIGMAETLTRAYIPTEWTEWVDALVFVILILVLLVKPTGILGKNVKEKV